WTTCHHYLYVLRLILLSKFPIWPCLHLHTLSLHDALPISPSVPDCAETGRAALCISQPASKKVPAGNEGISRTVRERTGDVRRRSEEHTSELQSRFDLVCRLLLEKKKKRENKTTHVTTKNS